MGKDTTPKNGSEADSVKAIRAELAKEQKIQQQKGGESECR
jgi:hypothetical protein